MSFYKKKTAFSQSSFYRKKKSSEEQNVVFEPEDSESLYESFLEDWENIRVRHKGQQEILDKFRKERKKYGFIRMGRKGAKTTTNIDIAWDFLMEKPRRTCYICLPTITQAIEVYWDEKRIQWCDLDNPMMADKYIKNIDNNKHIITFINDSTIKLVGTWSEARSRGTQPNLMIVDEVQDCSADYLDAMEPNLAAKADSLCVMSGTPPRKKNHYNEWEDRIKRNPEGFTVAYSSYINTALPHLKGWLDNKRVELIAAGKEDVWMREYMAEDCFRSDDRVMPDIKLIDAEEMLFKLKSVDPSVFVPLFGLVVTEHHLTATYSVLLHSRFTGSKIFTLESHHLNKIWNRSYSDIYAEMTKKMEEYSCIFRKPWRKVVYDETNSFSDVITGFGSARTDLKWSKRGVPLLREMILEDKLSISTNASAIGVEAQNLLKEDDIRDFPVLCAMAMITNEFYQSPSMTAYEKETWDKMAPLREAGIVSQIPKQKMIKPYLGRHSKF